MGCKTYTTDTLIETFNNLQYISRITLSEK